MSSAMSTIGEVALWAVSIWTFVAPNPGDSTDFDALDATQSAQALLRIRRQLLGRGMS